ncbi:MAG TPA: TolC family protein [Longimicrobium sp.]|nr:TolC family protein [Longimicrobium sp.]
MRIPALLGLAMLAAPALHAQVPDTVPLTLNQALRTAEENNPTYRRALTEVGTARADVRRARGAFLPSVTLGLGTTVGYSRAVSATGDFGESVSRDTVVTSNTSTANQSLSLGQVTLLDGGQRRSDLRAARAGEQAVTARVAGAGLTFRADVSRRYWTAVRADRTIRLEEALLASARDRLEVTRALVRVGVRGPIDVLGAEVTVAEQEQALERARGEARVAQLDLRQAMGVMDDDWLRLTDEPVPAFDPAPLNPGALVERALGSHPRVQRAQLGVTQTEHRLSSAQAARWPRLAVSAGLGRNEYFRDPYSGLYDLRPANRNANVSFGVQIPLFNGYQTAYQIQSARAARDAAQEDARGERLAVEREVRGALVDLDNAYRAAQNAERTLGLNRRRLELAQQQYRVGALNLTDLTDAVERTARAERDALRTRFEFATAHATLEERLGGPVRP